MSGGRRAVSMTPARFGFGLVLLVVLGVILFVRPGTDAPREPGAGPPPPANGVLPSATPATPPSEEAFCQGYRMLASAQGQYAAQPDERGAELLREAADDLLATGVPDSMQVPARTGYFVEISGIYATLGEALDRRAVPGAAEDDGGSSVSGSAGEFGAWLNRLCPAF